MDISDFWGKTAADSDGGVIHKPVIHHLLDVAAAALRLQEIGAVRTAREAAVLSVGEGELVRISAFLAGLHDIGKFAKSFQCKVPELWPHRQLGPLERHGDRGHWRSSAIMLRARPLWSELSSLFPGLDEGLEVLVASVAGHHGQPPDSEEFTMPPGVVLKKEDIGQACLDAGLEAMRILRRVIGPEPIETLTTLEQCRAWSWRLAGLTTLADWVGSDSAFFAFEDSAMPAEAYWELALERADRAIRAKGLAPVAPRAGAGLVAIAPEIDAPRPMQLAADAMPLPDGPMLAIVEDTTGSGKTEAALALAARMIAAGKAEGLYFALPTMATANAMYGRLAGLHRRLFADGSEPSLVLAHGKAEFSAQFLQTIGRAGNGPGGDDNAAWCSQWIADNRRKAFFADIGAGTIDQAFLAVLKKKHLTLRQYGLTGRVLVVDEAHAFDAYMACELETLLAVHAAQGGSAIVLSATLPRATRAGLVEAFLKGLGAPNVEVSSSRYPLLTGASRSRVTETAAPFADALRREVAIERVADAAAAHHEAHAAAARGAAVLLIRNAVDEAIASFETISQTHAETHLFHARFAVCDRQGIEEEIIRRFGREAPAGDRAGRILVATQVVEQSLDLDFDLVISDLAPVDLLIQRAGRLWRHMDRRPAGSRSIAGPRLIVISPDPSEATNEKWLEPALGRGSAVYQHAGVMWRTAVAIGQAGSIQAPDNLRALVARVYDEEDVPDALLARQNKAEGERFGHKSLATGNLIDFRGGYGDVGGLSADQEIGTRLGEETVTLRLARLAAGRIVPWAAGPIDRPQSSVEDGVAWALSEVTVRKGWLGEVDAPQEFAGRIEALRAGWPEWERFKPVGIVADDGRVLLEGSESTASLTYDCAAGLKRVAPSTRG